MTTARRLLPLIVLSGFLGCGSGSTTSEPSALHLNQTGTIVLTEDGFQFSVVDDAGQPVAVTWTVVEGAAGGSIDAQGYYTAPATPGTYHVTATRAGMTATATLQVIVGTPEMSITPTGPIHLAVGGSQRFQANISSFGNRAVTWSLSGGGTLAADGFFTAPALPGTCTLTATSLAEPQLSKTVEVVVEPPGQPAFRTYTSGRFPAGSTFFLDQGLSGISDTRIEWSMIGGGAVNPDGMVTLPDQPGSVQVQMRSVAAPAIVQTASIEAFASADPVKATVQVSPATAIVAPGGTVAFTATVGGVPPRQRAVRWWIQEGRGFGGIVTSDGRYTAPTTPGTYHVVVTPLVEPRIRAVATVTVGS